MYVYPYLEERWGPNLEITVGAALENFFYTLWALVWSKNKVGPPLDPPLNNNNNNNGYYICSKTIAHNNYHTNESSILQGHQGEHDYCSKKRRFTVQNTKKCNCPAQIHVREIVAYPGYKVTYTCV